MASHVFFAPMPIKEYSSRDPRLLTSATALLESGSGSGSNLGSGTANRSAAREKRRMKARELFIAEDSTWQPALALEPGLCFVLTVGFAELGFEDFRLPIGTESLHRNQNEQKQKTIRSLQGDHDSSNHQAAKNVDRISNFGVEAACNKLASLRRN